MVSEKSTKITTKSIKIEYTKKEDIISVRQFPLHSLLNYLIKLIN